MQRYAEEQRDQKCKSQAKPIVAFPDALDPVNPEVALGCPHWRPSFLDRGRLLHCHRFCHLWHIQPEHRGTKLGYSASTIHPVTSGQLNFDSVGVPVWQPIGSHWNMISGYLRALCSAGSTGKQPVSQTHGQEVAHWIYYESLFYISAMMHLSLGSPKLLSMSLKRGRIAWQ